MPTIPTGRGPPPADRDHPSGLAENQPDSACSGLGGDMDCSATVTMIDLPDFVDALLAGTFTCNADTNGDFAVNGLDAQAFVILVLP